MSSILNRHSIAIFCCALPIAATAQSTHSIAQLDNIVVTASRSPQLQSDVIGDVTVVDKKELERAGQTSVAEILAKQPGIQLLSNGGRQNQASVYMRGTNANHTLVLINGVRMNEPSTGSTHWNTIDPALIERIEIVRGASSSLYGADAIGGVINIITTKSGEDQPLSAWGNIGYGTDNTFRSSAGLSGAQNGWDYSLGSSISESSGFNATTPSNTYFEYHPDRDGYTQHAVNGTLGYRWAAGQHIGITAYNSYINGDFDAGEDPWHPAISLTRQQSYAITSTNSISENWNSVLRFGFSKDDAESRTGDSPSYRFGSRQRSFMWQNQFQLTENHDVSVILERLEERPFGNTEFAINRRDTNAVAAVYTGQFSRHRLQASVRNDNISEYGNRATGGLGYDFDLNDHWTVGAAANTGFAAPSLTNLYLPRYSNPNLKPEKSRNVEAHISYDNAATQAGITIYQNKVRDLIATDANFIPHNVNKATIRGLTLTGSHTMANTTFHGSADFMNPRDDETGNTLARRAKQVYNLGVSHRIDAWDLGAEYQFVGKRYDDAANQRRLGGYSLFNLTAAYDFSKNVGVQVRWNNVFDKDYTNAYGYNTPGSNVFVNLSFRM